MPIKNFLSELNDLHEQFAKEINEPQNDRYVCYDGVVHPDRYLKSKIRLLNK